MTTIEKGGVIGEPLVPYMDIPNEVVGIRLEDTLEASVDFKNDEVNVKKQNIYLYHESIETSCWTCFMGYVNCMRWFKR